MKRYKSAIGVMLMAGLLVAGFSEASAKKDTSKPSPAATSSSSITFLTPSSFTCGGSVSWKTLTDWKGEGGKCGEGMLYTVVGEVHSVAEGYEPISKKPEQNN